MPDNECIFCKIVEKKMPSTVRYEDDNWLAFDDVHKTAPIHVLLVPKKHYSTLEEVSTDDNDFHAQLLLNARKIATEMGIKENYKIFINVGTTVQAIHHVHTHIMGGWGKDKSRHGLDNESLDFIKSQ